MIGAWTLAAALPGGLRWQEAGAWAGAIASFLAVLVALALALTAAWTTRREKREAARTLAGRLIVETIRAEQGTWAVEVRALGPEEFYEVQVVALELLEPLQTDDPSLASGARLPDWQRSPDYTHVLGVVRPLPDNHALLTAPTDCASGEWDRAMGVASISYTDARGIRWERRGHAAPQRLKRSERRMTQRRLEKGREAALAQRSEREKFDRQRQLRRAQAEQVAAWQTAEGPADYVREIPPLLDVLEGHTVTVRNSSTQAIRDVRVLAEASSVQPGHQREAAVCFTDVMDVKWHRRARGKLTDERVSDPAYTRVRLARDVPRWFRAEVIPGGEEQTWPFTEGELPEPIDN